MSLPKVIISPPLEDRTMPWCYFDALPSNGERNFTPNELEDYASPTEGLWVASTLGGSLEDLTLVDFGRCAVKAAQDLSSNNRQESSETGLRRARSHNITTTTSSPTVGVSNEREPSRRYARMLELVDRLKNLGKTIHSGSSDSKCNLWQCSDKISDFKSPASGANPDTQGKQMPSHRRTPARQWRNPFEKSPGWPTTSSYSQVESVAQNSAPVRFQNRPFTKAKSSRTIYVSATVPALSSMRFDALNFDSGVFSTSSPGLARG